MLGHGSGIVVGTGKDTEFGVVFEMMQDVSIALYLWIALTIRSRSSEHLYNWQWMTWPSDSRSSHLVSLVSFSSLESCSIAAG